MSPKRVLVGACGMGNGHSSRQMNLVNQIRARGHQVAIVTFGDGVRALDGAFSSPVPIIEPTHFPGAWVPVTGTGIDVAASARNSGTVDAKGDAWSFRLCEQATEQLGGEPDLVLTDYEPASAQIAYILGCRLVTTEQQSKFLMYRTPDAGGYTRGQEAAKLRYFFPAADDRIASSFFPIEWEADPRYPGVVIEPILRPDVQGLATETDERSIVVYMSPYGPMRQQADKLLEIFATFPQLTFKVFAKAPIATTAPNVEVHRFDRPAFTEALASCSGVISTAGHQLLSECLYLGKPVLGIPFDVYEQQFNAMMLEHCGIGMRTDELTPEVLREFVSGRDAFAEAAQKLAASQFTGESGRILQRLGL
ncbi:glycosyltransferase family protein [Micromonosporaceae bacterium Da 78-11]